MSYFNGAIKEPCVDWAGLYRLAQRNAIRRQIKFELTRPQFDQLVRRANGRCMLSGIPFDFRRPSRGARRPFAASLDRIESSKGYSLRNCRLVCVAVNIALNEWGIEPLLRVAQNLIAQQDQLRQNGPPGFVTVSDYLREIGIQGNATDASRIGSLASRLCDQRRIERALIQRPGSQIKAAYPRAIVAEAAAHLTAQ